MTDEEEWHVKDIRALLDSAATALSQMLLDQLPARGTSEGVLGLIERARLHLKAVGQ